MHHVLCVCVCVCVHPRRLRPRYIQCIPTKGSLHSRRNCSDSTHTYSAQSSTNYLTSSSGFYLQSKLPATDCNCTVSPRATTDVSCLLHSSTDKHNKSNSTPGSKHTLHTLPTRIAIFTAMNVVLGQAMLLSIPRGFSNQLR